MDIHLRKLIDLAQRSGGDFTEKLLIMDAHNYAPDAEEIRRTAVRGIVFIDGKLLLVENKLGELKLPGGGIEQGEDENTALVREVKEETGYTVIPGSVRPFGVLEEKRLSTKDERIWHQMNNLYFCDVYPEKGKCDYTESEKRRGFRQVFRGLDDALRTNGAIQKSGKASAWNSREYNSFLLIKQYLAR